MKTLNPWICAVALSALAGGVVADDYCDAGLEGNESSPSAYQDRGDRCEGIFKLEVNSAHLHLVSLVEVFDDFDTTRSENLTVEWSLPPDLRTDRVRLRAATVVPRTYYRMDTAVASSASSFSWSLDILDQLRYVREDLGVLGWMPHPKPPKDDRDAVYLPLRIWQTARGPRQQEYEVGFISEKKLDEAYVTLRPVDAAGAAQGPPLVSKKPLGYGYYPAKTPIFFNVEGFQASGLYELEILASFQGEGSGTLGLLLYHEEP